MTHLASLALGIALGVVAALWLVLWRSGAEPDEPAVTEPVPEYMRLFGAPASKTVCAKCGHAMHWRSCDQLVTVPRSLGVCLCRNDVAEWSATA